MRPKRHFSSDNSTSDKGISRFVNTDEFNSENKLEFKNGGSWCRFDSSFGKKYKVLTVKKNGTVKKSWNTSYEEEILIDKDIKKNCKISKGNKIQYIALYGFQCEKGNKVQYNRSIRSDIRRYFKGKPCVVCGTNSNIEIDHKNGLYNDSRVMNIKTQKKEDFQALCKHCNCVKRETIKKMKISGKRHSALEIPSLKIFGVAYTIGDETYDEENPDTLIGTYWYDPIDFIKKIHNN